MVLSIYNTLTKKKEVFIPQQENEVRMYVCGPTVNDVPHLGHARVKIIFDTFRKYLKLLGYQVKFVSNITDIEDKIILKAKEEGISTEELTKKNIREHSLCYKELGVEAPDVEPRPTEYINEIIDLIKRLEKKGYTYTINGDGVYYDVSKFKDYGKLSNFNLDELENKRKLKDETKGLEKKDSKDFVLWKFSKPDEPKWTSPWGDGRPGWHIECSAMSSAILGLPLDIHAGGQDLIFPHHEDEIAQSEAGYEKKFSNYWMHNGMVNVDNVKMSKSLGNFKTIRDLLADYTGEVIRYFILSTHYRKPIDFSKERLEEAKISYERLKRIIKDIENDEEFNEIYFDEFKHELDEDFNTAGALNVLWKIAKDNFSKGKYNTIKKIDEVFSLNLFSEEEIEIPLEISYLITQREKARREKNWEQSDNLRVEIMKKGYEIKDTKDGYEIKKI